MNDDKDYKPDDRTYDDYDYDYDEGYEEGYDEAYEDERYNRLLDEIADLKRTVTSPAAPYTQPYPYNGGGYAPPAAPYGANAGGEVAVYNELSRLREELSRAQNAQNMHMELSRLKEEMNKRGDGGDTSKLADELKTAVDALRSAMTGIETLKKSCADFDAAAGKATELLDRMNANGDLGDSLRFISEDISDIKETLGIDYEKLLSETSAIKSRLGGAPAEGSSAADASAILGELTAIREKLAASDEYDAVAEILSLREEVKAARIVDQNDVSAELEKLRADIDAKAAALLDAFKAAGETERPIAAVPVSGAPTNGELNMLLNEIVSLRDEIQSYKDEVTVRAAEPAAAAPAAEARDDDDTGAILEELVNLRAEFIGLKEEGETGDKALRAELEALKNTAAELKDAVSRRTTLDVDENDEKVPASKELNVVIGEIIDIKDELKEESANIAGRLDALTEKASAEPAATAEAVRAAMADFAGIRDDLEFVKTQLGDLQMALALSEPDESVEALKKENEQLRAQLAATAASDKTAAPSAELSALREELGAVRAAAESTAAELKAMRDEPDLSVMREILALRDEYQAMKEKLEKASERDDAAVKEEIGRLRDQMFAVSMASVGDGSTDKVTYESYNNIILDEISSLRDELAEAKKADKSAELLEDVAYVKEKLTAVSENDAVAARLKKIEETLSVLKAQTAAVRDDDLSDAFGDLKERLNRISSLVEDTRKQAAPASKRTGGETGDSLISRLAAETPDIEKQ